MLRRKGTSRGWTRHVSADVRFANATDMWMTEGAVHHVLLVPQD